jgi:transcription elongation GreA/GreB family factor
MDELLAGIDKEALRDGFVAQLQDKLTAAEEVARAVAASATHPEAKQENDKDTRALEETYLARGQAQRAADLKHELALLKTLPRLDFDGDRPLASGALVGLESEDGATRVVLMAPAGGGLRTEVDGRRIDLVTPASPLGQRLLGRQEGDEISLTVAGMTRVWEIVEAR